MSRTIWIGAAVVIVMGGGAFWWMQSQSTQMPVSQEQTNTAPTATQTTNNPAQPAQASAKVCTGGGNTYSEGQAAYYTTKSATGGMPVTDRVTCQNGQWYDRQAQTNLTVDEVQSGTFKVAQQNPAPAIQVTNVHSQGPATITISYSNLPKSTSALAVCQDSGACTEWVEQFTPSSPSGTYTMVAQNAFGAGSQKGLSAGKYKIVVIGSGFSDQVAASAVFTVQ